MKKNSVWIFYCGLWGLIEASLGYLIHLGVPSIAGLVLFPIGAYLMVAASKQSDKNSEVLKVAALASFIKLLDLFFVNNWLVVINPAVMILFEGAFVMLLFKETEFKNAIFASYGWRLLFVSYLLMLSVLGYEIRLFKSIVETIKFIFLDGLINALMITVIFKYSPILRLKITAFKALSMAILAIIVTVVI